MARDLSAIIASYLEEVDAGRHPSPEQIVLQHPEFADALREFFADHGLAEQFAQPLKPAGQDATPTLPHDQRRSTPVVTTNRFFGDYELQDVIAQGGMGIVYRARQTSLNRMVALKMILPGTSASDENLQRFRIEAEAVATLDHPNIVPIYEIGERDGQHFFTMKLIEGGSLAQVLAREKWNEASARSESAAASKNRQRWSASLVAKVARAVHFAHQRGILHRDLKPGNILLGGIRDEGRGMRKEGADSSSPDRLSLVPYVTDFGLAKRMTRDETITKTGAIVGTPSYMAPEQAAGRKDVTQAADIYSLGAILYHLIVGRRPFEDDSYMATLMHVQLSDPARPISINRLVDPDLETICLKCLEKEPHRRYTTAEQLADDLDRWLAGEPIQARPLRTWEVAVKWARRRPAIAALSGGLLTTLILGLVLVTMQWLEADRQRRDALQARDDANRAARAEVEERQAADKARQEAEQALNRIRTTGYYQRINRAGQEIAQKQLDRAVVTLDMCPWDLRGWEWHLLKRMTTAESVPATTGLTEAFHWLAVHPDGKHLAGAVLDNIVLYRFEEGKFIKGRSVVVDPEDSVARIAFSPDGRFVAGAPSFGIARVWNFPDLTRVATQEKRLGPGTGLAFSRDSRLLAAGGEHNWNLWDLSSGDLSALTGENRTLELAFDARERWVTCDQDGLRFWKRTGELDKFVARGHNAERRMAASRDGKLLAVGEERWVRVFSVESQRETVSMYLHGEVVNHLAFHPDGKRLAGVCSNRSIKLWDALSGAEILSLNGHDNPIGCLAFSEDGNVLFSCDRNKDGGGAIRVWNGTASGEPYVLRGHTAEITALLYDRSGLLSASKDLSVRVWDPITGDEQLHLPGFNSHIESLALTSDGKRLFVGAPGEFGCWDLSTRDTLWMPEDDDSTSPLRLVTTADAVVINGATTLCFRDPATGKRTHSIDLPKRAHALIHRDGIVAAALASDVHLWAADRSSLGIIRGHSGPVRAMALGPDILITADRNKLRTWEVRSGNLLSEFDADVTEVALSPDGNNLATTDGKTVIHLRDLKTGRVIRELSDKDGTRLIAFSADGHHLAWASGTLLKVVSAR